jgi:hypothetical protein
VARFMILTGGVDGRPWFSRQPRSRCLLPLNVLLSGSRLCVRDDGSASRAIEGLCVCAPSIFVALGSFLTLICLGAVSSEGLGDFVRDVQNSCPEQQIRAIGGSFVRPWVGSGTSS